MSIGSFMRSCSSSTGFTSWLDVVSRLRYQAVCPELHICRSYFGMAKHGMAAWSRVCLQRSKGCLLWFGPPHSYGRANDAFMRSTFVPRLAWPDPDLPSNPQFEDWLSSNLWCESYTTTLCPIVVAFVCILHDWVDGKITALLIIMNLSRAKPVLPGGPILKS